MLLTLIGIYKLLRLNTSIDQSSLLGLMVLFILLPNVRVALLWEVHDETYALPLIVWALYALITKKLRLLVLSLALLCIIKETMFLVALVFGLAGLVMHRDSFSGLSAKATRMLFVAFIVIGFLGFTLYTKVLPGRLFTASFRGFLRIVTWEQLFSLEMLRSKAWWIMTLLFPVSPFLLLHGGSLHTYKRQIAVFMFYCFPALPFIASVLISNFQGMYHPYNYYAVIPATFIFCAVCLSYRSIKIPKQLILFSICLSTLLGPHTKVFSELRDSLFIGSHRLESVRELIPKDSVVVVADYEAAMFFNYAQITRLFHANRSTPRFDYIVLNKSHKSWLSLYLRSWSEVIFEDSNWIVRRALPSVKVKI